MRKLFKAIFPRFQWDRKAGAGILKLQDGDPVEQVEIKIPNARTKKMFIADLDANGEVIAIEVLQPKK